MAVWIIQAEANAIFEIPKASSNLNRALYYYQGDTIEIEGEKIGASHAIDLHSDQSITLTNGSSKSYFLFLQGKPINEPVAQYGPFVANSQAEIQELMYEFQRTQFGGWPWQSPAQVHDKEKGRFAVHTDGTEEVKN